MRESLTLLTSYATAKSRIQYSRLLTFEQALGRLVTGHAIETIAYIDHQSPLDALHKILNSVTMLAACTRILNQPGNLWYTIMWSTWCSIIWCYRELSKLGQCITCVNEEAPMINFFGIHRTCATTDCRKKKPYEDTVSRRKRGKWKKIKSL